MWFRAEKAPAHILPLPAAAACRPQLTHLAERPSQKRPISGQLRRCAPAGAVQVAGSCRGEAMRCSHCLCGAACGAAGHPPVTGAATAAHMASAVRQQPTCKCAAHSPLQPLASQPTAGCCWTLTLGRSSCRRGGRVHSQSAGGFMASRQRPDAAGGSTSRDATWRSQGPVSTPCKATSQPSHHSCTARAHPNTAPP